MLLVFTVSFIVSTSVKSVIQLFNFTVLESDDDDDDEPGESGIPLLYVAVPIGKIAIVCGFYGLFFKPNMFSVVQSLLDLIPLNLSFFKYIRLLRRGERVQTKPT